MVVRFLRVLWRALWPQALLAVWLVVSGTINILDGLDAEKLLHLATASAGAQLGVEARGGLEGQGVFAALARGGCCGPCARS